MERNWQKEIYHHLYMSQPRTKRIKISKKKLDELIARLDRFEVEE